MNRTILVLAAVGLWALVVPAGADTVDSWFIAGPDIWTPAIETWTSTSGGTGDGLRTIIDAGEQNLCYLCIGRDRPGILNQTGGTITNNSYWGTNIGRFTTGTYNMSGTAVFTTLGSRVPEVDLGTCDWGDLGIWTLTDQAAATVGNVGLGWWGQKGTGRVFLSGGASLSATGLTFATAGSYISFADGSSAALTVAGKGLSDFETWVTSGYIRVDEATQSDFSKFQVVNNTLSLLSTPAWPGYLAGDFNKDGEVGPEDFGILKDNFGLDSLPFGNHESWTLGDANDDGEIGPEDFGMLKDNFGLDGGPTGTYPLTNAPEPATLSLLALGGLLAARKNRRRQ